MTGNKLIEDQEYTPCNILVLDWDGNIEKVYASDKLLLPVVINEDDSRLYTVIKDYQNPELAYFNEYKL